MIQEASDKTVIVGGGIIGLGIAWEIVRTGKPVTVFDKGRIGRGATWASAGMLGPATEITFEEIDVYRLGVESIRRWPGWASDLESDSGQNVDYRTDGSFIVADDRDSAQALRRFYAFQMDHKVPVEWVDANWALEREPFLSPRIPAAIYSETDHQVDARLLVLALEAACRKHGASIHENTSVTAVLPEEPAVITDDGDRVDAEQVILAAGAWCREISGLEACRPDIRPVKGQMIELKMSDDFGLAHVIRGPEVYMAPKGTDRLLVGATSEEMGFDTSVTAGGLYKLLEDAWRIVPGIYDLEVTDTWAGLRPAAPDNAPLAGPTPWPRVIYATGHFRHGILHAPVAAQDIARLAITGEVSEWLELSDPRRFLPSK